jgi:hypothetical protein
MEELKKKKVPELKDMLRKMKKKVSGNKAELIDRILGSSSSPSESSPHVIDLKDKFTGKNGKLKLGSLIINIHNNLGGDPSHPYIRKVAKQANAIDKEEEKYEVVDKLEPHIKKAAKKWPEIKTVSKKPVAPEKVAKAQKLKEKVSSELKEIKKSSGFDPAFKAKLAGIFG